jgi:hypothetical protein
MDIDGNKEVNEPKHANFVANMPYCEDGLYCFHIMDCSSGTYTLTAEECLNILCEYYTTDLGRSPEDAIKLITEGPQPVSYGTCEKDVSKWKTKYELTSFMKTLRADWWWTQAGYGSTSCTNIVQGCGASNLPLGNCQIDTATTPWGIMCDTNCIEASAITIVRGPDLSYALSPTISCGKVTAIPSIERIIGPPTGDSTTDLCSGMGSWSVILTCTNPARDPTSAPLTITLC